jgi:hypothetical protein
MQADADPVGQAEGADQAVQAAAEIAGRADGGGAAGGGLVAAVVVDHRAAAETARLDFLLRQ